MMAAIVLVLAAIFLLLWDAHPVNRWRPLPLVAAACVVAAVLGVAISDQQWGLA